MLGSQANMIYGAYSEKEIESISKLLDKAGIHYKVQYDQSNLSENVNSNRGGIDLFHTPHTSTHVLAIEIEISEFSRMSEDLKKGLNEFGVTDMLAEVPEFSDDNPAEPYVHPIDKKYKATDIINFIFYTKFIEIILPLLLAVIVGIIVLVVELLA